MKARAALLAVCAVVSGCGLRLTDYHSYHGDGAFTVQPAASWICQDGYTVDLGTIDLTSVGEVTRHIDGLPPIEATIGLAVDTRDEANDANADPHRSTALVEVTLRDGSGHIVLSRRERLSDWITSFASGNPGHAYLYQQGGQAEFPVAPGAVRVERFPVGADDSWGTYFTPRRGARYTLHFTVEGPDPEAGGLDVRLKIRSVTGCL